MNRAERILLGVITLLTVAAGVARYASGVPDVAAFILAGLALAGLAWVVSFATEQVGGRFGPAITGLMQSTLGNLPEFFVVIFALQAGEVIVAETAILGSILVNALLVLGLAIIVGAQREKDGIMRFSPRLPNDTATLLLIASFIIVLVGLATQSHDPASHHIRTISIIGAIAILVVYAVWVRQYLTTPASVESQAHEAPRLSTTLRADPARDRRRGVGVRLGLVRARARADDRHAAHLARVRGPGDRGDRGQRGRARGRGGARRQGPVRARDLGDQELGRADRRVPVSRCWCWSRCSPPRR